MNEYTMTPEVEAAQRKVADMTAKDADMVAVAVMAFEAGRVFGEGRARQEQE